MDLNEAVTTPQKVDPIALISVPGGIPDLDADLRAAISAANGAVVRVRVPLGLFVEGVDAAYGPWRKVNWIVEFRNPEAFASAFRQGLDDFIRTWVKAMCEGQAVEIRMVAPAEALQP